MQLVNFLLGSYHGLLFCILFRNNKIAPWDKVNVFFEEFSSVQDLV